MANEKERRKLDSEILALARNNLRKARIVALSNGQTTNSHLKYIEDLLKVLEKGQEAKDA